MVVLANGWLKSGPALADIAVWFATKKLISFFLSHPRV